MRNQHEEEHHHLAGGLDFAELARGNHASLPHGDHAQAVNGEFTRQNQHDDPARQRPALNEHHHGGEVEQLVRDGVDELAEIGNQVAGAGDMAVKIIRQGSDGEHGGGEQIANEGLREHQRHHHRNQRDAQERQFVGQVHAITPVRS